MNTSCCFKILFVVVLANFNAISTFSANIILVCGITALMAEEPIEPGDIAKNRARSTVAKDSPQPVVITGGALRYLADDFGNTVPDFSMVGYRNGGVALPVAPVSVTLKPMPASEDDSNRIQAAIDIVAKMPELGPDGVKGAVLLSRGSYRCGKTLTIPAGVTLRGEGQDADGTVITATMRSQKEGSGPTLIIMKGGNKLQAGKTEHDILDEKVPIGAKQMKVAGAAAFKPGDHVLVERKATKAWIHDLKMDQIKNLRSEGKQWSPEDYTLRWQSRVVSVKDDIVSLDTPVVCALERCYGGGVLLKCSTESQDRAAAVERLRLDSIYQVGKENSDEDHAWIAINVAGLVDSWVRDVTALHFALSCVSVSKSSSRITVQDCAMIDPISKIIGGRRYSFVGSGQYVLFQRCYTRNGRHDFANGACDVGPSVYLDCVAEKTHADIGPHHRWSCGQLYDNVKGGQMRVQDRGSMGTGHGWAGNSQVFWNCSSSALVCQKAWIPSAQNWAIGCVGVKAVPSYPGRPEGYWQGFGQHVVPRSLYLAQLKERFDRDGGKGDEAIQAVTTPEQRQGQIWEQLTLRFKF